MALNVAKITLVFQQDAYGWTENYFLNSPSVDLSVEIPKAQTLATKRAALCGAQTNLPYLKISREQVKRDVYVESSYRHGNSAFESDAPDTALLCNKWSINWTVKGALFLRGIWDAVVLTGGQFDFSNTTYYSLMRAFEAYLKTGGFGFLGRDPALAQQSAVTAVVANVDNTVKITVTDPIFLGYAVGTKLNIFVAGVTGAASVNGPQIVKVVDNTKVSTVKRLPILPYTSGGNLSFNVQQFIPINHLFEERIVERKVGRPLYLSRGRSRGRKLA